MKAEHKTTTAEKSTPKSLVAKLADIINQVGPQKHAGYNDFHKYTYFTEAQLMDVIQPLLAKAGLILTTSILSVETREITNAKGKPEQLTLVKTEHVITDGAESLTLLGAGQGVDPADKGLYKAITGASKYFLQKNFMVSIPALDAEGDEGADRRHEPELKHNPHSGAEEKTAKQTVAGAEAVKDLRDFLAEHVIPESFVVELAAKGKLAEGTEKGLDELRPGTVSRMFTLRNTIKARWDEQDAPPMGPAVRTMITGGDPVKFLATAGVVWDEALCPDGKALGARNREAVQELIANWKPRKIKGEYIRQSLVLDAALCVAQTQTGKQ